MNKREYGQICGLARALDVVGERWTLLVVRNLLLGPARYSDLLRGLPGITTNLLAQRLRDLEENGLIERVRTSAGGGFAYALTAAGQELEPAVHALARWGRRHAPPTGREERNVEWFLAGLRGRYRGGLRRRVQVTIDGVPYSFDLTPERAEIERGTIGAPDARIEIDAKSFVAAFSAKPAPRTPVALKALASAFSRTG